MDSLTSILEDVEDVFHFDKEIRPQDRAHAYLTRRRVPRGFSDTAMQCAVEDMVKRAYDVGALESCAPQPTDVPQQDAGMAEALLLKASGELLECAMQLRDGR